MLMGSLLAAYNASVLAECALSQPIPAPVAETDQVFAFSCALGWIDPNGPAPLPCPAAAAPQVEEDSERAQGVTLVAVVPGHFGSPKAAWWKAWSETESVLWEYRSEDCIPDNAGPGTEVKFGAPGLLVNSNHRFAVAFEYQNGAVDCYSQYSAVASTTGFSTSAPKKPDGMVYIVEDDFQRPATDIRAQDGDGLGPEDVWEETTGAQNSKIANDDGPARLGQGSFGKWVASEATHWNSYVELKISLESGTDYNFELVSRLHKVNNINKYYFAKILNDREYGDIEGDHIVLARWDMQPEEILRRWPDLALQLPDTDQPKCNEAPFVAGVPLWYRLSVEDDDNGDPVIMATIAWNCGANDYIEDCANVCQHSWTDTDLVHLPGEMGTWSYFVHHADYQAEMFRTACQEQ